LRLARKGEKALAVQPFDRRNPYQHLALLSRGLDQVSRHLAQAPPRRHMTEEWTWYLKFIGGAKR
jgi:hypothetical protein